ncbi:MAG: hypothetical protein J1G01_01775 [Clostridiales bacterium]|nr:hypothetical protein [Clostridiales bacterium]
MANKRAMSNLAKVLAATMGAIAVSTPLVGCGKSDKKLSNKTSPLVLATDVLDGVFNPFFYTSGSDGEIVSQTQIGMLSSDRSGALIANWKEPCVALDYSYVTTGDTRDDSEVGDAKYKNFYTDYYFALKDNIVFSDGVPLTKDDVLFNIYMYLDPAYNGSNTMYSVNIKGLSAYRAQTLDPQQAADTNNFYNSMVEDRINVIYDWIDDDRAEWGDWLEPYDDVDVIADDIAKAQQLFKEELVDDWNSAMAIEDVAKDYDRYVGRDGKPLINENWQAFLVNYGIITPVRTFTADGTPYYYLINTYCDMDEASTEHRACHGDHSAQTLQNYVYTSFFDKTLLSTYKNKLASVITYYATATTFRDYLRSDVIEREVAKRGGLVVKSISGIEILEKQSEIPCRDKDGELTTKKLLNADEEPSQYDVLHITINGLDPKAIQNFAFTVAPGHYYSNKWNQVKTIYGKNDEADQYFGVDFANSNFMNRVRQIHLPLGAGPYLAANSKGKPASSESEFFESNTVVYFERNENFLLGAPKIHKLRYQVVNSNMLYNSIKSGQVHYGSPSMDIKVLNQLNGSDRNVLHSASANNLGYGYIGINARFVPNIWVRRAIMATLDPSYCVNYYGGGENASIIRRPMSRTLDKYYDEIAFSDSADYHYYPYGGDVEGEDNRTADEKKEAAKAIAQEYLRQGNCTQKGNVLHDNIYNQDLRYTFTIAGNTEDHPAYNMLVNSKEILDSIGFEIKLKQDSRALSLLAAGELTVWAAAWSSSSDPDMYQVYHKDSKATSINAWGYSFLNSNRSTAYERNILDELSDKIEEAREYNTVEERKPRYIDALNMLMQLAIEFPTYQRKVYYVWRSGVFDESTMFTGAQVDTYQTPLSRIWEVSFKEG